MGPDKKTQNWGDGAAVKSTGCSSRGPRFKAQHTENPNRESQLPVTPVSRDLRPLWPPWTLHVIHRRAG